MRNHSYKRNPDRDNESREEDQENYQPVRRVTHRSVEDEEAEPDDILEIPEDDAEDHTMEKLEEDDLAHMQGPDA